MSTPETRHAGLNTVHGHAGPYLCRAVTVSQYGRRTKPGEAVNCPDCRIVLNALRLKYPEAKGYQDGRK